MAGWLVSQGEIVEHAPGAGRKVGAVEEAEDLVADVIGKQGERTERLRQARHAPPDVKVRAPSDCERFRSAAAAEHKHSAPLVASSCNLVVCRALAHPTHFLLPPPPHK